MFPERNIVESIKAKYPAGTRVVLDHMEDQYARDMVPGVTGTVDKVDDIGTIHVNWDNGHHLGVAYGEDQCHIIWD